MNNLNIFNSIKIKSFDDSDFVFNKGRHIERYHYSSPGSFISIIKGDGKTAQVRFSDARYMNDRSELVVVARAIIECLDFYQDEYKETRTIVEKLLLKNYNKTDYLQLAINEIDFADINNLPFSKTRHFVFCMSKNQDSLHMWNYYTKSNKYQGYNIGIDIYDFIKSFDTDDKAHADIISISYGEVIYNKKDQREEVKRLLDEVEKLKGDISFKQAFLRSRMEMIAPFFKDESFKDEQEYRIVFSVNDYVVQRTAEEFNEHKKNYFSDNLKKISFDFFERNGVLVPYMQVPVVKDVIKSITIAPMVEGKIAEESLHDFLHANSYKKMIINKSKVPVRF